MTYFLTFVVVATPWLYVRSGQRLIVELGVDPDRNRDHPWKVPPAELVLLASGLIGWIAALGLAFALVVTFNLPPPFEYTPPAPTVYLVPIA